MVHRTLTSYWNRKFGFFKAQLRKVNRPAVAGNWTQATWLVQLVLYHYENGQLSALTILYIYCTGGTEIPQLHTRHPLSMYACAVRAPLGVDRKFSPSEKNPYFISKHLKFPTWDKSSKDLERENTQYRVKCKIEWVAARCVTETFQYHLCSTYRGLWGLVHGCSVVIAKW